MNKEIQFLAIGDLATDAFIRLEDAHVSCSVNRESCELCMRFGDKIPFAFAKEVKAVGNSANAAVSAARLGLSSGLITHVGDDIHGKEAIATLLKNGVATRYVLTESGKTTNYHYVLWFESERTILIKHESFSYRWTDPVTPPQWLYISSLGNHTEAYHDSIIAYIEKNLKIQVAFQPGTFQLKLGIEKLQKLYKRTSIFVCNVEEARLLLKNYRPDDITVDTKPPQELARAIAECGPEIVLITDGPRGAYAYDGKQTLFQPPYPDPEAPKERTGAGDAFASTFVSALALGESLETALMWAPINSMSVVQYIGAQEGLLSREQLIEFLRKAPTDHTPRVL